MLAWLDPALCRRSACSHHASSSDLSSLVAWKQGSLASLHASNWPEGLPRSFLDARRRRPLTHLRLSVPCAKKCACDRVQTMSLVFGGVILEKSISA